MQKSTFWKFALIQCAKVPIFLFLFAYNTFFLHYLTGRLFCSNCVQTIEKINHMQIKRF